MNRTIHIVLITVFLFSTIVGSAAATAVTRPKRERYAETSSEKIFGKVDPKKALIYVIRHSTAGFAIYTWTFYDDHFIGLHKGRSYFFTHVEPGKHLLWSRGENISPYEMDFKAGETYYFKQRIFIGLMTGRVKLELMTEEEGKKLLEDYKYKIYTPTYAGRKKGDWMAKKYFPQALKKEEKLEKKELEK